jgi:hypothetical protein
MPWSYTPSIGRYPMRAFKSMQSGHNQTATVSVLPQSKGNAQIISRRTSMDLFTRFEGIFILLIRIPFMLLHNIRSSFALYKAHSHYTKGLHKMHSFFTLYKALSHYTKLLFKPGVADILYQNQKMQATTSCTKLCKYTKTRIRTLRLTMCFHVFGVAV